MDITQAHMHITQAQYTLHGVISAVVDGQFMSIPPTTSNRHYRELVEQGIDIAPYVEPEPITVQE